MKKGIIFDLDGTLWDSSTQVVPAWNIVLKRHKEIDCQITISDMQGFMGKQINEIAKIMLPDMELEKSLNILKECCNEEQVYLREHGGILYPNLESTLTKLKNKCNLYIVSNCQHGYIESFLEYHKMHKYFDDIECSERTGKSKGENIRLIIERNNLGKSVYIGDTQGDLDAANMANIPFVFAEYGFGNINCERPSIKSISELADIIESIL